MPEPKPIYIPPQPMSADDQSQLISGILMSVHNAHMAMQDGDNDAARICLEQAQADIDYLKGTLK
jgi:hypothetical protein